MAWMWPSLAWLGLGMLSVCAAHGLAQLGLGLRSVRPARERTPE
jgi:hypothetical protein